MFNFKRHIVFWCTLVVAAQCLAQNNSADSLLSLIKTSSDDTIKISRLFNISNLFADVGNHDSALFFAKKALTLAELMHKKAITPLELKAYHKRIGFSKSAIGLIHYYKGDYLEAMKFYKEALEIFNTYNMNAKKASVLGNMGLVFMYGGDYPKALDYYLQGLKIDEEIKDKSGMAKRLGNIGIVYEQQGDFTKAIEYYEKALRLAYELNDKARIATQFGNIGNVYNELNNKKLALENYQKALKIAEEIKDKKRITVQLINIGLIFLLDNNNTTAIEYYRKALRLAWETGDKNRMAILFGNIGLAQISLNKFSEAHDNIIKAIAMSDALGLNDYKKEFYGYLSTLYEKSTLSLPDTSGKKFLSNEQMRLLSKYYYIKYIALRDTLMGTERQKDIVRKQLNFEFDKKQREDELIREKERAIAKQEAQKKNIILLATISGLFLLFVFSGFVVYSLRKTKKQKKIIELQKQFVDEKQKEILDSIRYAKRIQQSLLTSEKYIDKNLKRLNKT